MSFHIVTYPNFDDFKAGVDTQTVKLVLGIRQVSSGGGVRRTPYVMIQARCGDELHVLKLLGSAFDYWGKDFPDHEQAREDACDWQQALKQFLIWRYVPNFSVIPGCYWQSDLKDVPGVYLPNVPEITK